MPAVTAADHSDAKAYRLHSTNNANKQEHKSRKVKVETHHLDHNAYRCKAQHISVIYIHSSIAAKKKKKIPHI